MKWWQNLVNKISRFRKSDYKGNAKKKSSINIGNLRRWVVIVGLLVVVGFIFYISFSYYNSLSLQRSWLDEEGYLPEVKDGTYTILISNYDESNTYAFLDSVFLVQINQVDSSVKGVLLSPDFSFREGRDYKKFRTLMSDAAVRGEDPIFAFQDKITEVLGIQIDRYLIIENSRLIEVVENLGLRATAIEDLSDQDFAPVSEGEQLKSTRLMQYLASEVNGTNQRYERQIALLDSLISRKNNLFFQARVLWALPSVFESVETNLTSLELLDVALALRSSEDYEFLYIDLFDTFLIETDDQRFFVPNLLLTDEKIRNSFAKPSIVREQLRIEIYNATDTAGLASRHKRLLENLGANVVRTGNYPDTNLDESVLYISTEDEVQENLKVIDRITRGEVEVLDEEYPFNHSGELILVLGADVVPEPE